MPWISHLYLQSVCDLCWMFPLIRVQTWTKGWMSAASPTTSIGCCVTYVMRWEGTPTVLPGTDVSMLVVCGCVCVVCDSVWNPEAFARGHLWVRWFYWLRRTLPVPVMFYPPNFLVCWYQLTNCSEAVTPIHVTNQTMKMDLHMSTFTHTIAIWQSTN